MNLLTILDMVQAGHGDRLVLGTRARGLTGSQLATQSRHGGLHLTALGARTVIYVGENGLAFPLALFASAAAGIPFLPLNYRLARDQLTAIAGQQERPFIIADDAGLLGCAEAAGTAGLDEWRDLLARPELGGGLPAPHEPGPDDEAVLLMTSGT